MLVDSHCHLDFLEDGEALDGVVARARRAGVGRLVTICTKLSEFDRVRAIAERHEGVTCSVGVHPHEAGPEGQGGPDRPPIRQPGSRRYRHGIRPAIRQQRPPDRPPARPG